MDPVTLIVTALAAGSSAGAISALQDDVKATVKAAYAYLRGLTTRRVAGQPGAEFVLAEHEADPETWADPLAKKLAEAGAADDANLVEAARALMELVDAAGTAAGRYNVTIKDSQGIQVGDHNVQVNRFGG
jgi:RIP homotypic interaction motif